MKINRKTIKKNLRDVREDKSLRRISIKGCTVYFHIPNDRPKKRVRTKMRYFLEYIMNRVVMVE